MVRGSTARSRPAPSVSGCTGQPANAAPRSGVDRAHQSARLVAARRTCGLPMPPSMKPLLLLALAVAVMATAGCPLPEPNPEPEAERAEARARVPAEGFRAVVHETIPAIVFIQAEVAPPPALERLFPELRGPVGMGSGVIFREDGFILTNNHVVQGAERVLVVLHDRRYFEAEVIGRDPSTEVAVVRIPATGLTAARIGDSDAIALGDLVLAMGSPLGLDFSVTAGIVSGIGRAIGIIGARQEPGATAAPPLEHFIQTDAALSLGNSGGPLLNSAGEVIGINTAIAAPPGVPTSFGFAIPSNLAMRVAEQLIRYGEVRRAFLGVHLMTVTPALAEEQRLTRVEGAAVARVEPGSPAERGGLRAGDIILGIGEARVLTVSDLQAHLAQLEPGATVALDILRDRRPRTLSVRLEAIGGGVPAR